MGANFLDNASHELKLFGASMNKDSGLIKQLQGEQAAKLETGRAKEYIDKAAFGDIAAQIPQAGSGIAPQPLTSKFSPDEYAHLQSLAPEGTEKVATAADKIFKRQNDANLQDRLPNLLESYRSKRLIEPEEYEVLKTEIQSNPEAALSRMATFANSARSQTGQAISAKNDALKIEAGDLKTSPEVIQHTFDSKVTERLGTYTPDQISSIDLADAASYPGMTRPQAARALDMIAQQEAQGNKSSLGFLDKVQNLAASTGLVPPSSTKVLSPAELAKRSLPPSAEAERLKQIPGEQKQLIKQKEGLQFRGPRPAASSPESKLKVKLITVQAPGQAPRQIYSNKLEAFKKAFPGAKVNGK